MTFPRSKAEMQRSAEKIQWHYFAEDFIFTHSRCLVWYILVFVDASNAKDADVMQRTCTRMQSGLPLRKAGYLDLSPGPSQAEAAPQVPSE